MCPPGEARGAVHAAKWLHAVQRLRSAPGSISPVASARTREGPAVVRVEWRRLCARHRRVTDLRGRPAMGDEGTPSGSACDVPIWLSAIPTKFQ